MKMAASAPFMKQCPECNGPIDDYTNDFIHHLEVNFGEIEDCQAFLSDYKKYPNSVTKCMACLPVKWRLIKYENLKNRRQQTQKKKPLENYPKNTYALIYRNSYWVKIIITIILAFSLPCLYTWMMTNINNENKSVISEEKLISIISKLKDQFPSLHRGLLKKINGAFSRLKSPGEPFVLLLLHDDSNKKTTDCLASYTSIIAKQNIFTDTSKSLWMNATEWSQYSDQNDQNLLNEKLITPLKENEVLVLENLQDLPWSLANSLHYLCDSENPQIAKAMYILELKVTEDDLNQLNDGDKIIVAERTMNTAWINAPSSFRAALISRLTSYVDAVLFRSDKECLNDLLQPVQSERSFIRISP